MDDRAAASSAGEDGGAPAGGHAVLECGELAAGALEALFARYGIDVVAVADDEPIPGSYWGEPEAGIRHSRLYLRRDTPVHSALHEGCHLVCMGAGRRAGVERDAHGDELEEGGVCYLQVLLAERLVGVGAARMCADMDSWGYSFRAGSTRRWLEEDAADAREWLAERGLLAGSEHVDVSSAMSTVTPDANVAAAGGPLESRAPCASS